MTDDLSWELDRDWTYRERVHFLSFESWQFALCFLAAYVCYAQTVGCGFAVFDPFVGARGILNGGVQGEMLFFVAEEFEVSGAREDWAGVVSQSLTLGCKVNRIGNRLTSSSPSRNLQLLSVIKSQPLIR